MAISRADPSGSDFPFLDGEGWNETSPRNPSYNCVAWAAWDNHRWWQPNPPRDGYWPLGADDDSSVGAFERAFASLGYSPSEGGELEDGFEKIAFYAIGGEVTHAARQLPSGRWTSKLGRNIDIEHTLRGLEGPTYGTVVRFLKRRRTGIAGSAR